MNEKPCCACSERDTTPENVQTEEHACCTRKKIREPEEYKKLINRLNRVEGQIRGIRKMVEEDAYCPDILTQTAAATAALNAFSRELLSEHIHSCVKTDILAGKDETIDELLDLLRKMMH